MAIITRKDALTTALTYIPEDKTAVREVINKMIDQLAKSHTPSDEARAKANEKRKADTAAKRAEFLKTAVPVVRKAMTSTPQTDKEIYAAMVDIPTDLTVEKVRYMLVHNEVGADVVKCDNGKNPNTYYIKEEA